MDDKGIDSFGIEKQIVTLKFHIDEIKSMLSHVTEQVNSFSAYYKGDALLELKSKYADLSSKYPSLYSMLLSCCDSLTANISNYQNTDNEISEIYLNKNI